MPARKLLTGLAHVFRWSNADGVLASNPTLTVDWPAGAQSYSLTLSRQSDSVTGVSADRRTLTVRPAGGYFSSPGFSEPGDELKQVLFDQGRAFTTLDWLYRDGSPMAAGQQIDLMGVTVEITEVTQDGRPAEAAFHFLIDPQTPAFRWMCWKDGAYVPFTLPAVGESVTLPAPTISY